METPTGYTLQWSTSSSTNSDGSFTSPAGQTTFPATGNNNANLWFLNSANVSGLAGGGTYYFVEQASAGSSTSNYSQVVGPVTLQDPQDSGSNNLVTGQVSWTGAANGPLYVGFFDTSNGQAYVTQVGSNATPPTSPATYSVYVPSDSSFYFFAVIDNNNNGLVDPGDFQNVNSNSGPGVVSIPMSGSQSPDLTLPTGNVIVGVQTAYTQTTNGDYTNSWYQLSFGVAPGAKQPIAATLLSGPNVYNPVDMGWCGGNCNNNSAFQFSIEIAGIPQVGDTYTFNVTYTDGTSDPAPQTGTVQSVLGSSALVVGTAPLGSGISETPSFDWTYPSNPGNYAYSFYVCCGSNGTIWQIPGQNSKSNGFAYTDIPSALTWGVDPTNSSNTPSPSTLSGGGTYQWSVESRDIYGNTASDQMNFQTVTTPLTMGASLPAPVVGVPYGGYFTASGGVAPYNWTGTFPVGNNNLSYSPNSDGSRLYITGAPTSTGQVQFQVTLNDSASDQVGPSTYSVNVGTDNQIGLPGAGNAPLGAGLVGVAYGQTLSASGGPGGNYYQWAVNGTSIPANKVATAATGSDGLTFTSNGSNVLTIGGTPATASAGLSLAITVTDATNSMNTATATYSVPINSPPDSSLNGNLTGTYVCLTQGFKDSDSSRWASLSSVVLNGSGAITSGVWDQNSRNSSSAASGTVTGTYSVGSDYNGILTTTSTVTSGGSGSQTDSWAIAITGATSPAQEFRMVESDDVGSSPSGQHAAADCYLADKGAFNSALSGNSFVYSLTGESGNGAAKTSAGQFALDSSGDVTSGYMDQAKGGQATLSSSAFTGGSYGTPDSTTGRATLSLTSSNGTGDFALYLIDANRGFLMGTDTGGVQAGQLRKQQQSSYSISNMEGNAVMYIQGVFFGGSGTTATGYYSEVYQVSGDSNGVTLNQTYLDANGTYTASQKPVGPAPVTFGNVPGRASISSGPVFYLYDNGSGFEITANSSGSGGLSNPIESGAMEPQTQTTASGDYMEGRLAPLNPTYPNKAGQYDLDSIGDISGGVSTGNMGAFLYDAPLNSYAYSFDNTTYGSLVMTQSGNGNSSCVVINPTRMACTTQTGAPAVFILQQ